MASANGLHDCTVSADRNGLVTVKSRDGIETWHVPLDPEKAARLIAQQAGRVCPRPRPISQRRCWVLGLLGIALAIGLVVWVVER